MGRSASGRAQPTHRAPTAEAPRATETPPPAAAPAVKSRRSLAQFISENTNVVSSFVIGIAGLAVTSTYQCNQGELQRRQAEAQMKIAREQADNSWRIERAKILSENLKTLTARGGDTVEQRYGVLLSLLRGNILEPDVAVSYALELGRDNPEYMRSVLTNIDRKDVQYYQRLQTAYVVTCEQRYGVTSLQVTQCASDKLAERSAALALTVMDNLENPSVLDEAASPMSLLADERDVYPNLLRMVGLFAPYLHDLYERRMAERIDKFMAKGPGARLVATLALSIASNDLSTDSESDKALRAKLQSAVEGYLTGPGCELECRLRVFGFVLSNLGKSHGLFEHALRTLFQRPRTEIEPLLVRLHTRLQLCQHDPNDGALLREGVILPVLLTELGQPKPDQNKLEELLLLLSHLPEPTLPHPSWPRISELLTKVTQGRYPKALADKRADVQKQRRSLIPMIGPVRSPAQLKRRPNFCIAADESPSSEEEEQ